MSYRVRLDNFEGPFDLLLYLVSRQRVDIGSISVSEIVDQYLAYVDRMQRLDLDVASDFLLVASTLLDIKAASLIPSDAPEDVDLDMDELTPDEARDILVQRLFTYLQYKKAAVDMNRRFEAEGRLHTRGVGPDAEFLNLMPDYLHGVKLDDLAGMCANMMARREVVLLESEHIAAKPIPLEPRVRSFYQRISQEKHVKFSQLMEESPSVPLRVVSFLAILELYKQTMVELLQEEQFGDIDIDFIEDSGELVFDSLDEEA
ncbi:segregation and condensation protein A [Slackia heliotrinireducens]|uniref:segregation and condensation protein A n=1 Tax=Slackia heliotrinireducens TaxID=84110 RepID=UPI003315B045